MKPSQGTDEAIRRPTASAVTSRRLRRAAMLVVALLLAAGIFLLGLADDNETNAVLLLLVAPIGLVAWEFGLAGGAAAAAASLALFAVAHDVNGGGAGPIGYLTRAVVFFGFAAAIGLLRGRRSGVLEEGPNERRANTPARAFDRLAAGDQLSPRELEVLELLARGATNAQIAAQFVLSEQTVKSHVKHILRKLEVGNRTEAALRYVQLFGPPAGSPSLLNPAEAPRLPAARTGQQTGPAPPGGRREHSAKVVGFSQAGRVLVRLDGGRTIEVPLVDGMRNRFEVGSRALVYLDGKGTLLGWYLPEVGIGVDIQDDRRLQGE